MPNFTTEDLLLYIYDELEPKQSDLLNLALQTDWALKQKYQILREANEKLFKIKLLSPRNKSITSIVKYAKTAMQFSK